MLIILEGDVISWRAHAGYGRKAFNPLYKEREQVRWQVKQQCEKLPYLVGPLAMTYVFHLPIPKSASKKRKAAMLSGIEQPTIKKDVTNMLKFYEDCLKEFLFDDDSQVIEISAKKTYAEKPRVVICITEMNE